MADLPPGSENIRMPKYEFLEGHFYCDGIRVQPSQMTISEVMKYIPTDFQAGFLQHVDGGKAHLKSLAATPSDFKTGA